MNKDVTAIPEALVALAGALQRSEAAATPEENDRVTASEVSDLTNRGLPFPIAGDGGCVAGCGGGGGGNVG